MSSQKIRFTEITDHQGEISKIISLDPETGKLRKKGKASIWDGHSEQRTMLLADLPNYFSTLPSDKAITLGISDYESAGIVATGKENLPETIARNKEFFKFSSTNQLLFFDYDSRGDGQDISPDQFIGIISSIIPEFENTAKVINYSASSFIFDQDGKKVSEGDGFHVYFIVENSSGIKRFKDILLQRLWLKGYGYIGNSSDGKQLVRTIFDTLVFSPERLDFAAGAVCKGGLIQRRPAPEYIDGGVLNTFSLEQLNYDELSEYSLLESEAKKENKPVADKISGEYDKKETDKLVVKGISPHKAKGIIKNRKRLSLVDEDTITFDDGTSLSISELLDSGEEYDLKTMYDPIEPEKGKCKARFYWNEGKTPLINSFVHGERVFSFNRYDYSGNHNRGKAKGNMPTYPVEKFYTPDEAGQKLEHIIEEFINTGKDTAVLYEAGGGKTKRTIEKIADEHLKRKGKFKVAYFVNGHRIANERIDDFWKEIDIPKIIKKFGGTSNKDDGGITIISGFAKKCLRKDREDLVFDKKRCDGCYYNAYEHKCPYINQYGIWVDDRKIVLDRFRIYQHAHLFQPSSYDYGWEPDFIVVDEDVVSNMVQILHLKKEQNKIIGEIVAEYLENGDLQKILNRKKGPLKKEIHYLYDGKEPSELTEWEMKLRDALNILLEHASYNQKKKMDIPTGEVWVEGDRLYVGWLREINKKWQGLPMLYLDASGNEEIISRCLGKDFDFHKVRCVYQDNVEVIQVENLSLSKYWINKEGKKKIQNIEKLKKLIDLFDYGTGFISYKNNGKDEKGVLIPFIENLVPDEYPCGWFGNLRGLNEFEELSTLVVMGRHKIGSEELQRISRIVYADGGLGLSGDTMASEKTIRMKDRNHLTLDNWEYTDDRLQQLSDHMERAETYQAIHRLRLVWGDLIKRVIYVSNEVVDVTVDRLMTFDALLKGTIQFEDLIFNIDVCDYMKNDEMAGPAGISERTVRDLKKEDSPVYEVLEVDVREIKSRKRKRKKFVVSREIMKDEEELWVRLEEIGYKILN